MIGLYRESIISTSGFIRTSSVKGDLDRQASELTLCDYYRRALQARLIQNEVPFLEMHLGEY
jgi:hypothetical protein